MTPPVAVTGAAGFVGQALVAQLLAAGHRMRALVHRTPLAIRHPDLEVVTGGLADEAALTRLMEGCAGVVHVAGLVRGRSEADFLPVNADAVARVARIARTACVTPRVVLISSLAAREPQLSPYAASKHAGEARLASVADDTGLSCAVLRPPAIYGRGDRELLPLFRLMARGLVPLPGAPGARASLLHVDDLATAAITLLESDAQGTFELHDGHAGGYDWAGIAETVERVAGRGRGWRVRIPGAALRGVASLNLVASRILRYQPMLTPGKVNELRHPDWVCDNTAISHATGWHPAHQLYDGLLPLLGRPHRKIEETPSNVI
ncbi:NAD-dependent epimerase/dehydratase family protein [Roseovarius sp. D22-M7]|uniref:NAD-dependent epimerase/dehydratase family protein n=1 Tax=Roseovarius sp. D22-M7 TaxID=3127116 RepID=UPI00300FF6F1